MEFTTGTATRCSGGNHYSIPITINGVTRDFNFTPDDIQEVIDAGHDNRREQILTRLISAVKESGATTLVQIRNAISSKTFRV